MAEPTKSIDASGASPQTSFEAERPGARRTPRGPEDASSASTPVSRPGMCPSCLDQAERQTARQMRLTYLQAAHAFVAAVEAKDPYTREHSFTTCNHAVGLALRLKLPISRLVPLRTAALLHDIGKIGIPDAILNKPGPLTPAEFNEVKRHPQLATDILRHTRFFKDELPIILHHHEWYDGSGYPAGLVGADIPFEARILGVADAVEAMFARRSYKGGYSIQRVRQELVKCSGSQFDPRVADTAIQWLDSQPERFAPHAP